MNSETKEASLGSEAREVELSSRIHLLEKKQQQQMQQMEERVTKMEEFLSKVVERVLPKVEELLARQSPPANNPPSPSGIRRKENLGLQKFDSRHQLLQNKQIEEQKKMQQEMEKLQIKQRQMEEFLSNVVGKVMPKVEELLSQHSTAASLAEKGATTFSPTTPSTSIPATRPSTTTSTSLLSTTIPATIPTPLPKISAPVPSSTTIPARLPSTTTPPPTPPRSLLEAAERGDVQSLRQMLAAERRGGARVITEELQNCLIVAGNGDMVRALLGNALLSVDEEMGKRALNEAASDGRLSALEALVQAGFKSPYAVYGATEKGNADCLQLLLRAGWDPNVKSNSNRETPLHCAAFMGATQCARLLLDAGADVNAPSYWGTPIRISQNYRHEDTTRLLRERGGRL